MRETKTLKVSHFLYELENIPTHLSNPELFFYTLETSIRLWEEDEKGRKYALLCYRQSGMEATSAQFQLQELDW